VSRPSAGTTNGNAVPDADACDGVVELGGDEAAEEPDSLDWIGAGLGFTSRLELAEAHAAAAAMITASMTATAGRFPGRMRGEAVSVI